ncbi:hypothetical protein [Polyangium aurulentum]|uniref:hypothetical protein n=1 Tax=Polyangium aurulentum TaxID=2567896 RepID=UPI0010AE693F|nr:hypothetical protein [Polyangium aurulentum]UQA61110.1 hypothetical protein E8A73_011775 [Polyangium aurulentum]
MIGEALGIAFLGWITTGLQFVLALAVLGIGVGVVYKAHPVAGLSLAGAAALSLLGSLFWQVFLGVGARSIGDIEMVVMIASIIQAGLSIMTGVLVIVAMMLLSRALGRAPRGDTYR